MKKIWIFSATIIAYLLIPPYPTKHRIMLPMERTYDLVNILFQRDIKQGQGRYAILPKPLQSVFEITSFRVEESKPDNDTILLVFRHKYDIGAKGVFSFTILLKKEGSYTQMRVKGIDVWYGIFPPFFFLSYCKNECVLLEEYIIKFCHMSIVHEKM